MQYILKRIVRTNLFPRGEYSSNRQATVIRSEKLALEQIRVILFIAAPVISPSSGNSEHDSVKRDISRFSVLASSPYVQCIIGIIVRISILVIEDLHIGGIPGHLHFSLASVGGIDLEILRTVILIQEDDRITGDDTAQAGSHVISL